MRPPEPYKGKGIRYGDEQVAEKGREARMSSLHDARSPGFAAAASAARWRARRAGPRLAVFRSNRGIFAQLIDDENGRTLAASGWLQLKGFSGDKTEQAAEVGKQLAEAAKAAGVTTCVFDRGGYLYHGRVKALADGAREGGLEF